MLNEVGSWRNEVEICGQRYGSSVDLATLSIETSTRERIVITLEHTWPCRCSRTNEMINEAKSEYYSDFQNWDVLVEIRCLLSWRNGSHINLIRSLSWEPDKNKKPDDLRYTTAYALALAAEGTTVTVLSHCGRTAGSVWQYDSSWNQNSIVH
jgi:hypothetical protein